MWGRHVIDDRTMIGSAFFCASDEFRLSNSGQLELLRAIVERGVPLRTSVRGFSMTPFIRDHDVLTIAPINGRAPRVGEVVAFTQTDTERLAFHRVLAKVRDTWLICGDNCLETDGLVPYKHILARVVRVERNGREVRLGLGREARLIAWLQRSMGLIRLRAWYNLPRRIVGAVLRGIRGR